jgi:glutamate-1-semialdehyde 2,1-aminomutase
MSAGKAQLQALLQPGFYRDQVKRTASFVRCIRKHIELHNYPVKIFSVGSIFWLSFSTQKHVRAAHEIDSDSMQYFKLLHHELLKNNIYFGPSGYEVGFISKRHSEQELLNAAGQINRALATIFD